LLLYRAKRKNKRKSASKTTKKLKSPIVNVC